MTPEPQAKPDPGIDQPTALRIAKALEGIHEVLLYFASEREADRDAGDRTVIRHIGDGLD